MSELLVYVVVFAVYAATVCFLFVMLFIHEFRSLWLRGATAVIGLAALALPVVLTRDTLGYPDPWPAVGHYDVYGWQVDEAAGAMYLFVGRAGTTAPYHLRVPFELKTALELQAAAEEIGTYKQITLDILPAAGDGGEPSYAFFIEKVFPDEHQDE